MPRKRWIKLWTQETLYGTTFKELEPDERAVWFGFLALAGDSPVPGTICVSPEVPYTRRQMCQILNVKPSLLKRAVDKMFRFGKININGDGCFTVTEWKHYQGDYVRMQESRERNKGDTEDVVTDVTRNVAGGTEQTRPEEEEESDQTRREKDPAAASIDSQFAELVQVFEQKTGQVITPANSERLDELRETYTTEWVGDAIIEAVEATGRWPGWKYTEAILERWERDGRGDQPSKSPAGYPDGIDPDKYIKGRWGHVVKR